MLSFAIIEALQFRFIFDEELSSNIHASLAKPITMQELNILR